MFVFAAVTGLIAGRKGTYAVAGVDVTAQRQPTSARGSSKANSLVDRAAGARCSSCDSRSNADTINEYTGCSGPLGLDSVSEPASEPAPHRTAPSILPTARPVSNQPYPPWLLSLAARHAGSTPHASRPERPAPPSAERTVGSTAAARGRRAPRSRHAHPAPAGRTDRSTTQPSTTIYNVADSALIGIFSCVSNSMSDSAGRPNVVR